jgi:hypothetical protein
MTGKEESPFILAMTMLEGHCEYSEAFFWVIASEVLYRIVQGEVPYRMVWDKPKASAAISNKT